MKKYEEMINKEVDDFIETWYDGDYNVFKFYVGDDFDENLLDEKELHEAISCVYSKKGYLYVELNMCYLEEDFNSRMKEWEKWREDEDREFYESRW